MKVSELSRYALCISIAVAMLAGCGGSQPPIGAPALLGTIRRASATQDGDHLSRNVHFAYVANSTSSDISAYAINASSGSLTQLSGSPFYDCYHCYPWGVAVDPTGKFAYVANHGYGEPDNPGNVYAYAINAKSGTLTQIQGSPFAAGTGPAGVAVDPTGKFAYVTNDNSDNLSAYAINTSDGALKHVKGSPFKAGRQPWGVAIDPKGKFVYVTNAGCYSYKGCVSTYVINASSGALTQVKGSPFPAGHFPYSVAIDPTGKFAYVANHGSMSYGPGNVSAYAINARTGALTQVHGSPFKAGDYPQDVAIDPTGKFAYVTNSGVCFNRARNSYCVYGYTIDASSGALKKVNGSPFKAGNLAYSVAIDPDGKFVYVTNFDGWNISAYAIERSSGALKKLKGQVKTGVTPAAIAIR